VSPLDSINHSYRLPVFVTVRNNGGVVQMDALKNSVDRGWGYTGSRCRAQKHTPSNRSRSGRTIRWRIGSHAFISCGMLERRIRYASIRIGVFDGWEVKKEARYATVCAYLASFFAVCCSFSRSSPRHFQLVVGVEGEDDGAPDDGTGDGTAAEADTEVGAVGGQFDAERSGTRGA